MEQLSTSLLYVKFSHLTFVDFLASLPVCHFFPPVCSPVGEGCVSCLLVILREKHEVSARLSNTCQVTFELLLVLCVCVCVFSGPASPINIFKALCLTSVAVSPV